jgi:hypothetical protein
MSASSARAALQPAAKARACTRSHLDTAHAGHPPGSTAGERNGAWPAATCSDRTSARLEPPTPMSATRAASRRLTMPAGQPPIGKLTDPVAALPADQQELFRARLVARPDEIEVLPLRQLACPMALLQHRHRIEGRPLSTAMDEALTAAQGLALRSPCPATTQAPASRPPPSTLAPATDDTGRGDRRIGMNHMGHLARRPGLTTRLSWPGRASTFS